MSRWRLELLRVGLLMRREPCLFYDENHQLYIIDELFYDRDIAFYPRCLASYMFSNIHCRTTDKFTYLSTLSRTEHFKEKEWRISQHPSTSTYFVIRHDLSIVRLTRYSF